MSEYFGAPELVLILGMSLFLVPLVLYLLTLRNALSACAPESRKMSPGRVWLLLIPLFNLIWHFVVVVRVAHSIRSEFVKRGVSDPPRSAQSIGLAMCTLCILDLVSGLREIAGPGAFLCWIVYWVMVARESRGLGTNREV